MGHAPTYLGIVSRIRRHADAVPEPERREEIAKLAAGSDLVQEKVNQAALALVGGRYVTVRERRPEEKDVPHMPPWVGCFVGEPDKVLAFLTTPYGGDTKEEALEDVDRIASKWGWGVVEP